jgi:hypothetical protein
VKDFIHLDATRNIAGQLTRLDGGGRDAFRAVSAGAFATEIGQLSAQPHGDLGGLLRAGPRHHARGPLSPGCRRRETILDYVTSWFLVHGAPERRSPPSIWSPPTKVKERRWGSACAQARPGRRAGELINAAMTPRRPPLSPGLGVDPILADYFFKLHAERSSRSEQDEGRVRADRPTRRQASGAPPLQARLHREDPVRAPEGRGEFARRMKKLSRGLA